MQKFQKNLTRDVRVVDTDFAIEMSKSKRHNSLKHSQVKNQKSVLD